MTTNDRTRGERISKEVHYSISGKKLYLFDDVEDQNIVTVTFHDVPKPLRADVLRHMADTIDDSPKDSALDKIYDIVNDLTYKQAKIVLRLFQEYAKDKGAHVPAWLRMGEGDVEWPRG